MPGPFAHIYTARRVADFLATQATKDFIRPNDDPLQALQSLAPNLLAGLAATQCAAATKNWPKFAAVGAIGPDLFFWLQDYNNKDIPCDEIMLAMSFLAPASSSGENRRCTAAFTKTSTRLKRAIIAEHKV